MKKIILCFLLLSLVLSVVSCNKPIENSPTDNQPTDNQPTDNQSTENSPTETQPTKYPAYFFTELPFETKSYQDPGVLVVREVDIQEKPYRGFYERTERSFYFNDTVHQYYFKSDGEFTLRFGINKATGKIVEYNLSTSNYLEGKGDATLDEAQCLQIATELLNEFVDASEYTVETDRSTSDEMGLCYYFTFVRVIDGVQTSDIARIWVTAYGDVYYYDFVSLGEMKGATLPSAEEIEEIESCIGKTLESSYNHSWRYDSHEIVDITFSRMADGCYALEYEVSVELFRSDTESDGSRSELVNLYIYLD